jgi:hypothetical protein
MEEKQIEPKYKYFIDLEWIPIEDTILKRRRYAINLSQIRRPEIVGIINGYGGKIYEVSDPFLFYVNESGQYEYFVYEIELEIGKLRVVKYRKLDSNQSFKMCIKSTTLDIHILKSLSIIKDKTSISEIKSFNSNTYYEIEKPIFVERGFDGTADIIGYENSGIYLSIGTTDNFINIGKSSINFRAKAQIQWVDFLKSKPTIKLSIFDIYQIQGQIMRTTYSERIKYVGLIIEQLNKTQVIPIDIQPLKLLDANNESPKIIIDDEKLQYLGWSKEIAIHAQYKKSSGETQLRLSDGYVDVKMNDPNLENEIITYIPSSHTMLKSSPDILTLDRYKTFRFVQKPENYDIGLLNKTDLSKNALFNKRNLIKTYATGKILVVSEHQINILDLEYDELQKLPFDIMEVRKIVSNYHTIVIDYNSEWRSEIEEIAKEHSQKIILFSSGYRWEFKDGGGKTFVFLVGTIGSGKSALIRKVRSMFNMSGGLFVAQIDKLIEYDIEFVTNPDTNTYWKLRKEIYNSHMDQLIGQSIQLNNSIILETTQVNPEYANWLKSYGYKVAVVIVNESYENIAENIKIRNQTKIRKTILSAEDYESFQANIPTYIKNADHVHYIKPDYSN